MLLCCRAADVVDSSVQTGEQHLVHGIVEEMRTLGQPTREICKGRAQHEHEREQD